MLFSSFSFAEQTRIAVAANFSAPIKALVEEFEQHFNHTVTVSTGSSGKFYAQIRHGAPFDVFLSADTEKPAALIQDKLALSTSQFTYAVGRLALWAPQHTPPITKHTLLTQTPYTKIALANPKLAPYGNAAMEVLHHLSLKDQTRPLWVLGENVAQAYQFVNTGNATMGFIALSQVKSNQDKSTYWLIPETFHSSIKQNAVLLNHGKNNAAAMAFLHFLKTAKAYAIIKDFGYGPP
ncbi:molybdate ABC transporter substrate-binding protein [Marinibactrum halimedae]|uniref:molybdate ABC transporter substrate-binding protein n=1 Tax=Marinibactrum halimedae TaxID=1444977 RepID=UPI001E3DE6D8|nr:molybdate ABC transporter substrate-binding protein [Marinibactrum halimedae]MCD9460564.1 molybdate ABC transporter substrate-binding protein [Marinibactrum halimedae]